MRRFRFFSVLFLVSFFISTAAQAAVYQVDPDHSTVSFKVRHLFSNVQGAFRKYQGVIEYETGKPKSWKAEGSIEAASIDTNVTNRDNHLRGADFFEVEKFPTVDFKTTAFKDVTENSAKVEGVLKIHGVEKPVVLDVEIHGVGKDPWGNVRLGLTAKTKINRKDFGINWNQALDNGGVLVGEEVDITLEIEAIAKQ